MKKKLKYILIVAVIGNCLISHAQDQGDHLEPVQSIYSIYDYQFDYYSKVRQVLFNGLSDSPEIRFQVMPSFFPENVVDIEHDRDNDKYYIIYHRCKKMIWSNEKWDKVKVAKYRSEIEKESVLKIKELFETAILQTKYAENEMIGTDGTNFFFSINNYGIKTGTIWSPNKGSQMFKFIEIAGKLPELAKSKKSIVRFSEKELDEMNKLITEIKYDR